MARGKRSTSEGAAPVEDMPAGEVDTKIKGSAAKVTLVKPLQSDLPQDEAGQAPETSAELPRKTKPRPKVGRSAAARKKKSDAAGQKTVKKQSKAKDANDIKSEEAALPTDAVQTAPEPAPEHVPAEPVKQETPAPAAVAVEEHATIREDIAQTPLPPDWDTTGRSRSDIKFTLFLLALFAAVNIGLVYLLNGSHKPKTTNQQTSQSVKTPSASPQLPAIPAQLNDTVPAPAAAPAAPAAESPAAMAPAENNAAAKPADLPPIPPAPAAPAAQAPSVPENAAPVEPVGVSPSEHTAPDALQAPAPAASAPVAPAPADAAADPQEKVKNQQELLSILNKN